MSLQGGRGQELSLRGLTKRYGKVLAVDQVSLEVHPGELLSILGPSGCGKSTLLKLIAGLLPADGGKVWVGERRLDFLPSAGRGLGFVFQNFALFPHLTVAENVAFGLRMRGTGRAERKARVVELLDLVGLSAHANKLPRQLSGGEQQRVALARALAPNPPLLLLDEPLSALDVQIRHHLRKEIAALQQRLGVTTVLVTHDQEEAFELGDRIAVMRAGRLVQVGSPREIYETPATEFVARFVGLVNVLEAEGEGEAVRLGRWPLVLPGSGPGRREGRRRLMVRPEDVALLGPPETLGALAEGGAAVPQNLLAARVVTALYLGSRLRVALVAEDGQPFTAELAKEEAERLGIRAGAELLVHLRRIQELFPDGDQAGARLPGPGGGRDVKDVEPGPGEATALALDGGAGI